MLAEDLLQALQGSKHVADRFVVRFLTGGKARFVDAVVDVVVDPAVQLVNFLAQLNRVVIPGAGTVRVKRGIEHANDFSGFIADDRLVFLVPQHRHRYASGVVRIGAQIELIQEIVMIKLITRRGREVTVERPAVFQHQRVNHRNRN